MPDVDADTFALSAPTTAVIAVTRAVDDYRNESRQLAGISGTELRILGRVAEHGAVTPGELASALGLTSGAITAATTHLVEIGLLSRTESPTDRRRLLLSLMPAAVDLLVSRYREIDRRVDSALAGVPDAERERIADLLTQIASAVRGSSAS